jgi:hypothetical protein
MRWRMVWASLPGSGAAPNALSLDLGHFMPDVAQFPVAAFLDFLGRLRAWTYPARYL